ncbi:MAG: hypothetical protein ACTSVG_07345 [Alphaproteobacteria bacterium]
MKRALMTTLVLAAVASVALPPDPARAQMVCGKRADIISQLSEKYGETRRSLGVSEGSRVVELYASDETGSWTILMTNPQGIACMMAAGQAFEIEPVKAAGSPA